MDSEAAIEALRSGQPIAAATVSGQLILREAAEAPSHQVLRVPVAIIDAVLDDIDAGFVTCESPVTLENVTVLGRLDLSSTFFLAGFSAVGCRFKQGVDFRWGGHNQNGSVFRLERCEFDAFANFEDEWFQGPVEIRGCTFHQGTNLLGNQGQPYVVTFDVPPVMEDNSGALDLDADPLAG